MLLWKEVVTAAAEIRLFRTYLFHGHSEHPQLNSNQLLNITWNGVEENEGIEELASGRRGVKCRELMHCYT